MNHPLFSFDEAPVPREEKAIEIFDARLAQRGLKPDPKFKIRVRRDPRCAPDEFRFAGQLEATELELDFGGPSGLLYGVGKILRTGNYENGVFTPGSWRGCFRPVKPIRAVYFASHFYNVFEVCEIEKMERYLEDMALLGYNYVAFAAGSGGKVKRGSEASVRDLNRRIRLMKYANFLGMKIRTGAANFGFSDTPQELRAKPTGHSFLGTEICVSNPKGMDYLMDNIRTGFDALADIDIGLFQFWPYDQGGCGCEKCYPYGVNGMFKLADRVLPEVRKRWPETKIVWSCWEFGRTPPEEWDMLYERINSGRADFIDYLMIDEHNHFPTYPLIHGLPGRTQMITFPEISMWGRAPWGGYGATPLPKRFSALFGEVAHLSSGGVLYSEGIFEDFNKVVYAGFFNTGTNSTDDAIREYARWELGIPESSLADFKRMIELMELNHRGVLWSEKGNIDLFVQLKRKPVWAKIGKTWEDTEEMLHLARKLDTLIPEWARRCWRWRLLYIRAVIDFELAHNCNEPNDITEEAMMELSRLYSTDFVNSSRRVAPFTDEWISHHIKENFKLNIKTLGVD